jgi:bifunctional non-homologous end joining protein LigD
MRIREDKRPEECIVEADKPITNSSQVGNESKHIKRNDSTKLHSQNPGYTDRVAVTNINKVYWKATKNHPVFLKKDLIDYYEKISEFILPYLEDRPLSLSRYPNGITGQTFYQKDWDHKKPDFVTTAKIHSEHRGD